MYTNEIFINNPDILESIQWKDSLNMKCDHCSKIFSRTKHQIKGSLRKSKNFKTYCSILCNNKSKNIRKIVKCQECHKEFLKLHGEIIRSKSNFCSPECYQKSKIMEKSNLICDQCNKEFYKLDCYVKNKKNIFCSNECKYKFNITRQNIKCKNCEKDIIKKKSQISNSKNNFCSRKCLGIYTCLNKTGGGNRSKLEKWLEEQLIILYPGLDLEFNNRKEIGLELDIWIPSLKLAFEINGPTHYQEIYKNNPLKTVQEKDKFKIKICKEKEIELNVVDTSKQSPFKIETSQIYLDIINNKIAKYLI